MDTFSEFFNIATVGILALAVVSFLGTRQHEATSSTEDVGQKVTLPNGDTVQVINSIEVRVDPQRDLHGPCVCRAPNGDLLLSHQDSLEHGGGDGFVRQWRSTDGGFRWQNEGPVADWRDKEIDALFGEYSVTPDNQMVMMVQLRKPLDGNEGIRNNVWYLSNDNGKTWQLQGEIDPSHKYAVLHARSPRIHEGVMYVGAWSRHEGNSLYVSNDNGRSWQRRSVIFPATYPDFNTLPEAGPPYYPHVMFLPNGTLLAMTYKTPPTNMCYLRTSLDKGHSWGPIAQRPDLPVWAPRMNRFGDDVLMVTGRDIHEHATVAIFSTDGGLTWGNKLIVDRPKFGGSSYAYSDSIQIGEDKIWVFTSSPRTEGKGDIIGVLLEKRKTGEKERKEGRAPAFNTKILNETVSVKSPKGEAMKDLFSDRVIPKEIVTRPFFIEDQSDKTWCMFPAIIQCADQELLVTYYRGTGHSTPVTPDTPRSGRVELIRSRDGGKSWSPPTVVFDTKNDDRETALTRTKDGSIYLTINTQPVQRPAAYGTRCWTYVLRSKDEGHTWEQVGRIHRPGSTDWDLYVYRPLIEFPDGTLAATGITEGPGLLNGSLQADTNQHMIAFSHDGGKTWGEHRTIAYDPEQRLSFREWNAVLLPSGKILAMQEPFGDERFDVPFEVTKERVYFSSSTDGGKTWSELVKSPFYGRACSFLVTSEGNLLFAGSPAFRPPHPPQTAISSDEGKTWKIIEDLPRWSTRSLYCGYYPNVIEKKPGTFVAVGGGSPHRSRMTLTSFRLE